MIRRLRRWTRFQLERWIQRGIAGQLLFMAVLVIAISLIGGAVARFATDKFSSYGPAAWWAFLRLTDPGYLGDDEGAVLRTLSTVITVLGYVVFMGSLIAILTQGLAHAIRALEGGYTAISMSQHAVVLGWTNRTPEIVLRLLTARGRLARFLERIHARKLRVVILADEVDATRRQELKDHLGPHWSAEQVLLRSGSSLVQEHLEKLDLDQASLVLIPGSDFQKLGNDLADTRVVKTLLSFEMMFANRSHRPRIVAEIFDPAKVPIARGTMSGSLDIVAGDHVMGRVISQSVRHRGLAVVYLELLSHRDGQSLFLRTFPELAGQEFHSLLPRFPNAVPLGLVRTEEGRDHALLNPPATTELRADDTVILISDRFESCAPNEAPTGEPLDFGRPLEPRAATKPHRILLLGWSHKITALVTELHECPDEQFELTVVSTLDPEERESHLERVPTGGDNVVIEHRAGDYTLPADVAALELESFDHIIFFARGRSGTSEEADARTILGYVLVRSLLPAKGPRPEVFVELLDPDNARLFSGRDEVLLLSPTILSRILAHVALLPELNTVYDALFRSGGAEIESFPLSRYGPSGESITFAQLQRAAAERGQVAIGVHRTGEPVQINPNRNEPWTPAKGDEIVVLSGQDAR